MSYVFEIQIADCFDGRLLTSSDQEYDLNLIKLFQGQIEQMIGGMLCFEHVHLPDVQPLLSVESSWVIKVDCCCAQQRLSVGDRIQTILQ